MNIISSRWRWRDVAATAVVVAMEPFSLLPPAELAVAAFLLDWLPRCKTRVVKYLPIKRRWWGCVLVVQRYTVTNDNPRRMTKSIYWSKMNQQSNSMIATMAILANNFRPRRGNASLQPDAHHFTTSSLILKFTLKKVSLVLLDYISFFIGAAKGKSLY